MQRTPERRRFARTRMISGGTIVSEACSQRCVVLNISSHGAGVHLLSPEAAPPTAVLHLPDSIVREATLRWQREAFAGYEFSVPR